MFARRFPSKLVRKFSGHRNIAILGIETSCDDTGAAVVDGEGRVLGEALHSQQSVHTKYGGIIPPLAQDMHRENIEEVVKKAVKLSGMEVRDVDAIAVTNRPGLPLSLLVGLRYAKHLARSHGKPLIPIHHMEAHALTARMTSRVDFPYLCLLASGGHCQLVLVKSVTEYFLLGETIDDAPGEALDKIARRLNIHNLPEYRRLSGGAAIEAAARKSESPQSFPFPLPLAQMRDCQFSFAGLKNSARRCILAGEKEFQVNPGDVMPHFEDFCAGFLRGITKHICHRTQRAMHYCEEEGLIDANGKKSIVFGGGVACNDFIFEALSQLGTNLGYETFRPEKRYCTDNGVMIAWNGVERFRENSAVTEDIDSVDIVAKCSLGTSLVSAVQERKMPCQWVKIPLLKVPQSSER
ncbi:probable tRNA N6-adenosine threonylcarbamoyltransferase, mitochondrial [Phlebotomus argentipes]|uniref:probable tRNA N6-adenosine threonylcarbamoyltransferase, mitochondrial n=1 Tax=Phlebotomus argentipes TaxID=94469 RepID=UPI002892D1E8|nr:probable tRNA N6-adenosine threonylcarbamoyltransferase, mitochondrial [Phlebotomus argentipes]